LFTVSSTLLWADESGPRSNRIERFAVIQILLIANADGVALMQDTTSVNFLQALEQITEHWSPRVIGRVNDQYVKVAKLQGQLAWHKHDSEDEMFLVVYGHLILSSKTRQNPSKSSSPTYKKSVQVPASIAITDTSGRGQ
jgi:hypothetical protein